MLLKKERKLQRLQGYDYSRDNHYFVTICTHHQKHFFGEIKNGEMILNESGNIVENQWLWLQDQYDYVFLDEFVVMPNHFHGILIINSDNWKKRKERKERNSQACSVQEENENQARSAHEENENQVRSVHEENQNQARSSHKENENQAPSSHEENENQDSILIHENSIKSLSQLVGAFKTLSSRDINKLDKFKSNNIMFKWHKSFHDRIIRDERELNNVRNYIKNNPLKWHYDIENSKEKINNTINNAYYEKIISSSSSSSYGTSLIVPSNNRPQ